jgi:hypothetical protein
VVQKVPRLGVVIGSVKPPPLIGNGEAELMLLVALTVQRQDGKTAVLHKLQQRTGDSRERRLLIVAAVESVQHPVKTRQADRRADARV